MKTLDNVVDRKSSYTPVKFITIDPNVWIERGFSLTIVELCSNTPFVRDILVNNGNDNSNKIGDGI